MREKPLNEAAIYRTIEFLKSLKDNCDNRIEFSLTALVKMYKVASGTGKACKELLIITSIKKDLYKWEIKMTSLSSPNKDREEIFRHLAISIKNNLLHKNKKTVHYPIPDFAGIADSLKEITERLAYLSVQNEKWLKTHKNYEKSDIAEPDLFKIEDQRLYIFGQIASGTFAALCGLLKTDEMLNEMIDGIVRATDVSYKKLLNKE